MGKNEKLLSCALKNVLRERMSEAEIESFRQEGFELKDPSRRTAVAIAVYKKAASGDLSAVKELRAMLAGSAQETFKGTAVRIIDDIGD